MLTALFLSKNPSPIADRKGSVFHERVRLRRRGFKPSAEKSKPTEGAKRSSQRVRSYSHVPLKLLQRPYKSTSASLHLEGRGVKVVMTISLARNAAQVVLTGEAARRSRFC